MVGGGVTGMTAALQLADQGFKVVLAERSAGLGGLAQMVRRTLEGEDVQAFIRDLIERRSNTTKTSRSSPRPSSWITAGCPACSRPACRSGPQMFYRQIEHGVTILATGALPNRPPEYPARTDTRRFGPNWRRTP